MQRSMGIFVACVLAVVALANCRGAERADGSVRAGWEVLGEKKVGFLVDHDVIPVTVLKGTYRQIQLYVEENNVHFRDIKVHYGDGSTEDIQVRKLIPAGGQTRVIDLDGWKRVINRVSIWYDTQGAPRNGRATVKVYGKH